MSKKRKRDPKTCGWLVIPLQQPVARRTITKASMQSAITQLLTAVHSDWHESMWLLAAVPDEEATKSNSDDTFDLVFGDVPLRYSGDDTFPVRTAFHKLLGVSVPTDAIAVAHIAECWIGSGQRSVAASLDPNRTEGHIASLLTREGVLIEGTLARDADDVEFRLLSESVEGLAAAGDLALFLARTLGMDIPSPQSQVDTQGWQRAAFQAVSQSAQYSDQRPLHDLLSTPTFQDYAHCYLGADLNQHVVGSHLRHQTPPLIVDHDTLRWLSPAVLDYTLGGAPRTSGSIDLDEVRAGISRRVALEEYLMSDRVDELAIHTYLSELSDTPSHPPVASMTVVAKAFNYMLEIGCDDTQSTLNQSYAPSLNVIIEGLSDMDNYHGDIEAWLREAELSLPEPIASLMHHPQISPQGQRRIDNVMEVVANHLMRVRN